MRSRAILAVCAAFAAGCDFSSAYQLCHLAGRCPSDDAGDAGDAGDGGSAGDADGGGDWSHRVEVATFGAVADGVTDATAAFRQALAVAAAQPDTTLELGAGTYLLLCADASNRPCFEVGGAMRLRLHGNETRLLFGNPNTGGFAFTASSEVTVANLTIDYLTPPFTQGTVRSITPDASTIDFTVDTGLPGIPDWICTLLTSRQRDEVRGYAPDENWTLLLGPDGHRPKTPDSLPAPSSCEAMASGWRLGFPAPALSLMGIGDHLVLTLGARWSKTTLTFDRCLDPVVSDVTIRTSPYNGVVFEETQGTLRVENVTIAPEPGSGRVVSTLGPGLFLLHNWAEGQVLSSTVEASASIGIIAQALPCYATATDGGAELRVNCWATALAAGDSVQVVNPKTGELRDEAVLVSVTKPGEELLDLVLDHPIEHLAVDPGGNGGDAIFNLSAANPGLKVTDCVVRSPFNKGLLTTASDSSITGSVFESPSTEALRVGPEFAYGVGPIPNNVTISGVAFRGGFFVGMTQLLVAGNATDGTTVPMDGPSDITIVGARFEDAPGLSLYIGAASDVNVTGAVVTADAGAPRDGDVPVMRIRDSADVTVTGLAVSDPRLKVGQQLVEVLSSTNVLILP
jgi:hypothetical protein